MRQWYGFSYFVVYPKPMSDPILVCITAFTLVYFAIPSIIKVARKKHLMDELHSQFTPAGSVPTLRGVPIFIGVLLSVVMWVSLEPEKNHIPLILFSIGLAMIPTNYLHQYRQRKPKKEGMVEEAEKHVLQHQESPKEAHEFH